MKKDKKLDRLRDFFFDILLLWPCLFLVIHVLGNVLKHGFF